MNEIVPSHMHPIVFEKDGAVFANSRDVAAAFEKEHRNVMRDIDNLIKAEPQLGVLNFEQTPYVDPQNGQTYRSYNMNRDGFTLLAMGFTGAKALKWKLRYIEAFNEMEKQIRKGPQDIRAALSDPTVLRSLLADYSWKVIELESRVEEMRPSVQALDRIATADGSMSITEAAKNLQIAPKELFNHLRTQGWIYRRPGAQADLAYQSKLMAGLLEHKVTTVLRADGTEKVVTQVRVTPKGLARLAKDLDLEIQEEATH